MGFIKKRLFLIVGLLMVLVSAGVYILAIRVDSANAKKLDELESQYSLLVGAGRKVVHSNVLAKYEGWAKQAVSDLSKVEDMIAQTSNRPLLDEKVFPEPGRPIKIFYQRFSDAYIAFIEGLLDRANAGDRPSSRQEQEVLDEYHDRVSAGAGMGGRRRGPANLWGGGRRGSASSQEQTLLDDLRLRCAESLGLYACADSFCSYDYWKEQPLYEKDTMLIDSWLTQIAAWIQEDVIASILRMNGDSESVLASPVKRLIEISFSGKHAGTAVSGGSATHKSSGSSSDSRSATGEVSRRVPGSKLKLPDYVVGKEGDSAATFTGVMTTPWTGRAGSETVDVVHFELAVVVDSSSINDFIGSLQSATTTDGPDGLPIRRNQITVLQMQIEPLDIEAEQTAGYYYGSGSIKVLRLICEYTFFKGKADAEVQGIYRSSKPKVVTEFFEPVAAVETKSSRRSKQ